MHAGFSMFHLRNDIALMRLVKPVQLGPKVGTVCFPRKNTRVAPGTKCWISGLSSLGLDSTTFHPRSALLPFTEVGERKQKKEAAR